MMCYLTAVARTNTVSHYLDLTVAFFRKYPVFENVNLKLDTNVHMMFSPRKSV